MQHHGELAVQRRASVWKALGSARVGATIPPFAQAFLGEQRFLVIGAVAEGVWATMLVGPPGFVRVPDERMALIDALPGPNDPLHGHFAAEREIGVLAIEPSTRRRIRINGQARASDDGLVVRTEQVYGNCPKYIQQRVLSSSTGSLGTGHVTYVGPTLTVRQRDWLTRI